MRPQVLYRSASGGFTLLELMTVVAVVAILCVMSIGAYQALTGKAQRASCQSNLRSLYAAAAAHVEDQGAWPQISTGDPERPAYAREWIDAFKSYGIGRVNWVCPSVQKILGNPDLEENVRVDYFGTRFGDAPRAAYEWPMHPWFMERGDVHGDGNLVIFANGRLLSISEVRKLAR